MAHQSITRRSLVAAFALPLVPALPAVVEALPVPAPPALPVATPPPDPVFAAIEAHIRAYNEFIAVLDDLAVAEQTAWHAPRGKRRAAKKQLAAAYAAERRFGGIENDAFERIVATVPDTLEGAVAALRYVREWFEQGHCLEEEDCVALIGSVERAICRAAARSPDGAQRNPGA